MPTPPKPTQPNNDKPATPPPDDQSKAPEVLKFEGSNAEIVREFLDVPVPPKQEEPEKKPAPKKTAPKAAPAAPAAAPLDIDKLGEAVGRGVATALEAREKKDAPPAEEPKPPTKPEDATPWLTPAERRYLPVLERMAKDNPESYKDLAARFTTARKLEAEYRAKWEKDKENKGKEFDPEAEEHNEFYASPEMQVDWEDIDFQETLADMKAEEKVARARSETDGKLSEMEKRERERDMQPKVAAEMNLAGETVLSLVGQGFELVAKDGRVDQIAVKRLNDEDPEIASVVFSAATAVQRFAEENFRLHSGLKQFDPKNMTALQQSIMQFAVKQESEMMAQPVANRLDGQGRSFLPSIKYYELPPEKRKLHWTFNARELNLLKAKEVAEEAKIQTKAIEERFIARAKKRNLIKEEERIPETQKPPPIRLGLRQFERNGDDEKPNSPEGGGSPGVVPSDNGRIPRPKTANPVADSLL